MSIDDQLVEAFIQDWQEKKGKAHVRGAGATLPIAWFGDSEAYFASPTRIVTVGLNPSSHEFDATPPRFPEVDLSASNKERARDLRRALDGYFETNPYWGWFHGYETILRWFRASYGTPKGVENRSLHIDLHSSIATNPTWGGLSGKQKAEMKANGRKRNLFAELLAALKPAIVLCSFQKKEVDKLTRGFGWRKEYPAGGKGRNWIGWYRDGGGVQVVAGANNRGMPFGGVESKRLLGTLRKWSVVK